MAMMDDGFQFKLGPPDSGFSLFLAERTKKVHFVRHAEGYHNVETKKTGTNECLKRGNIRAQDHPLWDARLTDKGIKQAQELRKYLAHRPSGGRSFTTFDLVVVSPLTRTLETAEHIFGRARKPGVPAFLDPGLIPEHCPERKHDKTFHVPAPRILVREECRERWGEYVCDGRRAIRDIIKEFPDFDFSEVEYDEDIFYEDKRETDEHCCERAVLFLEWLNKRPEKCIAVVTHSSFLRHLFGQFGGNLAEHFQHMVAVLGADELTKLRGRRTCYRTKFFTATGEPRVTATRKRKPKSRPLTAVLSPHVPELMVNDLAFLLAKMLEFHPNDRWSASQCLEYLDQPVFANLYADRRSKRGRSSARHSATSP